MMHVRGREQLAGQSVATPGEAAAAGWGALSAESSSERPPSRMSVSSNNGVPAVAAEGGLLAATAAEDAGASEAAGEAGGVSSSAAAAAGGGGGGLSAATAAEVGGASGRTAAAAAAMLPGAQDPGRSAAALLAAASNWLSGSANHWEEAAEETGAHGAGDTLAAQSGQAAAAHGDVDYLAGVFLGPFESAASEAENLGALEACDRTKEACQELDTGNSTTEFTLLSGTEGAAGAGAAGAVSEGSAVATPHEQQSSALNSRGYGRWDSTKGFRWLTRSFSGGRREKGCGAGEGERGPEMGGRPGVVGLEDWVDKEGREVLGLGMGLHTITSNDLGSFVQETHEEVLGGSSELEKPGLHSGWKDKVAGVNSKGQEDGEERDGEVLDTVSSLSDDEWMDGGSDSRKSSGLGEYLPACDSLSEKQQERGAASGRASLESDRVIEPRTRLRSSKDAWEQQQHEEEKEPIGRKDRSSLDSDTEVTSGRNREGSEYQQQQQGIGTEEPEAEIEKQSVNVRRGNEELEHHHQKQQEVEGGTQLQLLNSVIGRGGAKSRGIEAWLQQQPLVPRRLHLPPPLHVSLDTVS